MGFWQYFQISPYCHVKIVQRVCFIGTFCFYWSFLFLFLKSTKVFSIIPASRAAILQSISCGWHLEYSRILLKYTKLLNSIYCSMNNSKQKTQNPKFKLMLRQFFKNYTKLEYFLARLSGFKIQKQRSFIINHMIG